MRNESIDKLARRLAESVPENIRAMRADLEQNFRSVLRSSLSRLDLVTREEFEVQEAVLARTRQHCDAIEARVKALEAKLGGSEIEGAAKPAKKKTAKKAKKKSS
jgi:ubiquinone biosynthesis accessory factor UbiK